MTSGQEEKVLCLLSLAGQHEKVGKQVNPRTKDVERSVKMHADIYRGLCRHSRSWADNEISIMWAHVATHGNHHDNVLTSSQ